MLSILIPVYNTDATPLLQQIHQQLNELSYTNYEVLLGEDGSEKSFAKCNTNFTDKHLNFRSHYFDENLGAGETRNQLVKLAKGKWVLFFDADIELENDLIGKYLACMQHPMGFSVFSSGIAYKYENSLRYRWGKRYEEKPYSVRKNNPVITTLTASVLTKKVVLERFPFPRLPNKYGWEDRLWTLLVAEAGFAFKPIDAVVYHLSKECDEDFLRKVKFSIHNLTYIALHFERFNSEIRLLSFVHKLKSWNVLAVVQFTSSFSLQFTRILVLRMKSPFLLQVYKLFLFISLQKKAQLLN